MQIYGLKSLVSMRTHSIFAFQDKHLWNQSDFDKSLTFSDANNQRNRTCYTKPLVLNSMVWNHDLTSDKIVRSQMRWREMHTQRDHRAINFASEILRTRNSHYLWKALPNYWGNVAEHSERNILEEFLRFMIILRICTWFLTGSFFLDLNVTLLTPKLLREIAAVSSSLNIGASYKIFFKIIMQLWKSLPRQGLQIQIK